MSPAPVNMIVRLECSLHGPTLEPGGERICLACGALPPAGAVHVVRTYRLDGEVADAARG